MPQRNYSNVAPPLPLAVSVIASATTLTVSSTTGYPAAPFLLGLERGTTNEEVVLCTAKTATTFTVTRGYDGTTAKSHSVGTMVEHTVAAIDYREAGLTPMTTAERNALTGSDVWEGKVVSNTDTNTIDVYHGGAWMTLVRGDDSRLSDPRPPTAHTHDDRYFTETESDGRFHIKGQRVTGTANSAATAAFGGGDGLEVSNSSGYPSITFHRPSQYAPQIRATSASRFQAVNQNGNGLVDFEATLYDNGNRVYSASNPPSVGNVSGAVSSSSPTFSGTITEGTSDSHLHMLRAIPVETHSRNTTLVYTGGVLTSIVEKDGGTTVKTTTLNYTSGTLTSTVEVAGGKTITTTLGYTGADLTSVTRSVA